MVLTRSQFRTFLQKIKNGQLTDLLIIADNKFRQKNWWYVLQKQRCAVFRDNPVTDPLKSILINPEKIKYHSPVKFPRHKYLGEIKSGEWDLIANHNSKVFSGHPTKIEDTKLYQAMEAHWKCGVPWKKTVFVREQMDALEKSNRVWYGKCETESDIEDQCKSLDKFYRGIKTKGFRKIHSDISDWSSLLFNDGLHQITVNISRNGKPLFNGDGRHRLCTAKIAGIKKVPVAVIVRHEDWQQYRRQVYKGNTIPFESHPDLVTND